MQHTPLNSQDHLAIGLGLGSHTAENLQKATKPWRLSYNSEARIKRLKCFVFSWNQSRKSSASSTLLCEENCQSLIFLGCCDSILLALSLCSPLHTHTQNRGFLVNRPVCTGTDLWVIKWSHQCFPVTRVSVPRITRRDEQVKPSAPSCHQPNLLALPRALQAFQPPQSPFSLCYT